MMPGHSTHTLREVEHESEASKRSKSMFEKNTKKFFDEAVMNVNIDIATVPLCAHT